MICKPPTTIVPRRRASCGIPSRMASHEESQKANTFYIAALIATRVEFERGDYAAAEKAAREAAATARDCEQRGAVQDSRDQGEISHLAHHGARAPGTPDRGRADNRPRDQISAGIAARNRGDLWLPYEMANALYAQALTDPKQAAALLREAASLFDKLPSSMRNLHDVRQWRTRIQQAQGKSVAQSGSRPVAAEDRVSSEAEPLFRSSCAARISPKSYYPGGSLGR